MKNDNIMKWADDLAATTEAQGTGAMCVIEDDGKKHYCCLGLGSAISAPGIPVVSFHDGFKFAFGAAQADGLAPIEFVEWLGYTVEPNEVGAVTKQFDVYFDFPTGMRVRSMQDKNAECDGGTTESDHLGGFLSEHTAATLNDDDFTFEQIADVIRHFGLADSLAPPAKPGT